MVYATEVDRIPTERHRYDEIRSLYVNQLAFILAQDSTTEETRAGVDEKIDSFYEGDLEHATEALSALWEIVNKDGIIAAPSSTPSTVSRFSVGSSPVLYGRAQHFTYSGCSSDEPRQLDLCENGAHQVHSRRGPV